jgi:hypothetical protein
MSNPSTVEAAMRPNDFHRFAKTVTDVADVMSRRQLLELADSLYEQAQTRGAAGAEDRSFAAER